MKRSWGNPRVVPVTCAVGHVAKFGDVVASNRELAPRFYEQLSACIENWEKKLR